MNVILSVKVVYALPNPY